MKSQKNIYEFDTERVVSIWLLPFLFGVGILLIFIMKLNDHETSISITDILVYASFFFFFTGTSVFLFFNHLPYAKNVKVIVFEEEIEIVTNEKSITILLKDVGCIYEFGGKRSPWQAIRKWVFITANDTFVISSLTISWLDFHKHFSDKITYKGLGFPIM